jgi:DNA-binding transcriptional ArsR family regulator
VDEAILSSLRALVDQHRLRIVARLAGRPADAETLAVELRQPVPGIRRHLGVLVDAGLVEERPEGGGTFAARLDRVGELGRALAALDADATGRDQGPGGEWPHEGEPLADTLARLALTPDEAKILRSYLVDGRLQTIPAQGRKRDVILRFLLERVFTEDRGYEEKEVNQRLALFHPDVAALRRYLYDSRYVDRDHGIYTRAVPRPGLPAVDVEPS